ncbi:MAG TPA: hypothetical protein VF881_07735, partial [Polyangiaceae bacterium]
GTLLYASPEQLSALSKAPELLPLSDKMDTYCLAATLLFALVGPINFPGDGAETRYDIVQAQEIRARAPIAFSALPDVVGRPRELLKDALCRWMNPDPAIRPPVGVMADELEVLLEPKNERARLRERRRFRQKVVRRVTFAAIVVLASMGGLYAYSKRETIRLASELNKARAGAAASFDKLDTCIASHQLAQRDAATCRDARVKEQREHKAMLDNISRTGGSSEAERARQMQNLEATYANRIKACEDEVRTSTQERTKLSTEGQHKEAQLTSERDELKKAADSRAAELERCRTELGALTPEYAAPPTRPAAAPAPQPAAAPQSAPASSSSAAAPASSPAPAAAPSARPMPSPYE